MLIAITGPFGFIGSQLTKHLQNKHPYRLLSRSNSPRSTTINYDDQANLVDATKNCTHLIHLGGMAHLPQNTAAAQEKIHKANVIDTLSVAKAAASNNCQHFIYISSIKVNGEETFDAPFRHNSPAAPEDYYGQSKLEAEQSLTQLSQDTGMKLTIIRPGLVYGNQNKGNLATLEKLIKLHIPLPLKSLENKRSLINIDSLCKLIITCCLHPNAPGKTFLAADNQALSSAEIAQQLSKQNASLPNPILLPFPSKLLLLAARYTPPLKKLVGNLEIDTTYTQKTLEWTP